MRLTQRNNYSHDGEKLFDNHFELDRLYGWRSPMKSVCLFFITLQERFVDGVKALIGDDFSTELT